MFLILMLSRIDEIIILSTDLRGEKNKHSSYMSKNHNLDELLLLVLLLLLKLHFFWVGASYEAPSLVVLPQQVENTKLSIKVLL